VDSLTATNRALHEELDRTKHQLGLRSNELADMKQEMETQRANEIELKVTGDVRETS